MSFDELFVVVWTNLACRVHVLLLEALMGSEPAPLSGRPTTELRDFLLIQAAAKDVADVASLADRDGSGLVLSGDDAIDGVRELRRLSFTRPVLVDRRRYAGNSRTHGAEALSPWWITEQRRLDVSSVLTDSGYIGEESLTDLRSVLGQAADLGDDVTAVLPLHQWWLRQGRHLLIAEITRFQTPVALVLEHRKDPLGTKVAIQGLIEILQSPARIALLCTDVAALGALAFGAEWTAVGVRSALRHLYPISKGWHSSGRLSALIEPLLSIVSVDRIAKTWANTQDGSIWPCPCITCHGRSLDWLQTASEIEANTHTFEVLLDKRDNLTGLTTEEMRQRSWQAQCNNAIYHYDEFRLVERFGWPEPSFLRGWRGP